MKMKTINKNQYLAANKAGLQDGESGFASYYSPALQLAYNLGCKGIDLSSRPMVTGYRYGEVPETGISWNHADGRAERGVSLISIDAPRTDTLNANLMGNRPLVEVKGILLPTTGSDGEPLILALDCVECFD